MKNGRRWHRLRRVAPDTGHTTPVPVRPPDGWWVEDPIDDPLRDDFKRIPFARRVVAVFSEVASSPSSTVVGIVGPWGSGKTSTLKLIEAVLKEVGESARSGQMSTPASLPWRTGWLNPWLLSGPESIVAELMNCIRDALPPGSGGDRVRDSLWRYSGYVLPVAAGLPVVGAAAGMVHRGREAWEKQQTLSRASETLAKELADLDARILIIIDDIDRLQPDELLVLLKCVRAVGRLPNVHYVLAYDQATLIDVLIRTPLAYDNPPRALAYLEKIVTVRLDQPPTLRSRIDEMLRVGIDRALDSAGTRITADQANRLAVEREWLLGPQLAEPRQVKRFLAQLHAYLPLVGNGEIDAVDFVVLTHLRLSFPSVYALLSRNRRDLCAADPADESLESWRSAVLAPVLNAIDRGPAEAIGAGLDRLFPVLAAEDSVLNRLERGQRQRGKRASDLDYVDRYFDLNIEAEDWPDAALTAALTAWALGDAESAAGLGLLPFITTLDEAAADQVLPVLRRLIGHVDTLEPREAQDVLNVVLSHIPPDVADPLSAISTRVLLATLLATLLDRAESALDVGDLTNGIDTATQGGRQRLTILIESMRQVGPRSKGERAAAIEALTVELAEAAWRGLKFSIVTGPDDTLDGSLEDFGTLWRWVEDVLGGDELDARLRELAGSGVSLIAIASHFVELGRTPYGRVEIMNFDVDKFVGRVRPGAVQRGEWELRAQPEPPDRGDDVDATWPSRRETACQLLVRWLDSPKSRGSLIPALVPLRNPTISGPRNTVMMSGGVGVPDLEIGVGFLIGNRPPAQLRDAGSSRGEASETVLRLVRASPLDAWLRRAAPTWHLTDLQGWSVEDSDGAGIWSLRFDAQSSVRVGAERRLPVEAALRVAYGPSDNYSPALEVSAVVRFALDELQQDRLHANRRFSDGVFPARLSIEEALDLLEALLRSRTIVDSLWAEWEPDNERRAEVQTQIVMHSPGGMFRVIDIGAPDVNKPTVQPTFEVSYLSVENSNSWGPPRFEPDDLGAAAAALRQWARNERRWIDDQIEDALETQRRSD